MMPNIPSKVFARSGVAETRINSVLTDLLSHESQNFKAYLNGSLYSVLAIKEFKDVAKEMGLDALLSSFMKEDQKDTENYGQLEYIKQQISKPPEGMYRCQNFYWHQAAIKS